MHVSIQLRTVICVQRCTCMFNCKHVCMYMHMFTYRLIFMYTNAHVSDINLYAFRNRSQIMHKRLVTYWCTFTDKELQISWPRRTKTDLVVARSAMW